MTKPTRRYTITVEIGDDTWEGAVAELRRVCAHVEEHGPECKLVSGGYSGCSMVTIAHDPTMTHDRYMSELDEVLRKSDERTTP